MKRIQLLFSLKSWTTKTRELFEYAGAGGGFIDLYGYPYCRGRIFNHLEKDEGQFDDISEIFWASGACFFIRSEVYHSLGGFDEDYFAHQEEVDLCWRAKNQGYDVKICRNLHCISCWWSNIARNQSAKNIFKL